MSKTTSVHTVAKSCGCIEEHKTTTDNEKHVIISFIEPKFTCEEHLRIANEAIIKFDTPEAERIYKTLDAMIDELYTEGVDVSYFPDGARKVLARYAEKLAKEMEGEYIPS